MSRSSDDNQDRDLRDDPALADRIAALVRARRTSPASAVLPDRWRSILGARGRPSKDRVSALLDAALRVSALTVAVRPESPTVPFAALLRPLVDVALARVHDGRPRDPARWATLCRPLHERLAAVSETTFDLEFTVFRAKRRAAQERAAGPSPPDSTALYDAFAAANPARRLAKIARRHPMLALCWTTLVDEWVDRAREQLDPLSG